MPTNLTAIQANEESTYVITAAFTDEDGASVLPDSINWTLTDSSGNIINSREQVAVSVPAESINIVLSGDDLALQAGETDEAKVQRVLTIEAVYDSSYGNNLPLKDQAVFEIYNLTYIT